LGYDLGSNEKEDLMNTRGEVGTLEPFLTFGQEQDETRLNGDMIRQGQDEDKGGISVYLSSGFGGAGHRSDESQKFCCLG